MCSTSHLMFYFYILSYILYTVFTYCSNPKCRPTMFVSCFIHKALACDTHMPCTYILHLYHVSRWHLAVKHVRNKTENCYCAIVATSSLHPFIITEKLPSNQRQNSNIIKMNITKNPFICSLHFIHQIQCNIKMTDEIE